MALDVGLDEYPLIFGCVCGMEILAYVVGL